MSSQHQSGRIADPPPFEYTALPNKRHIRLVTKVVLEDGETRCTMESFELTSSLIYHALSYTWGDPRPKGLRKPDQAVIEHRIYLNGRTKNVTDNLYRALSRLASGILDQEAPIWIDAVCLNQDDLREKNVQVAMMDEIYTNASVVVAWLGEADGFTEAGLEAIRRLKAVNDGLTPQDYIRHQQRDIRSYSLQNNHWVGLIAIFCRAWFTRVWVIQEVMLARKLTVLLGGHTIPEDVIKGAATYLARSQLWFKLTAHVFFFAHDPSRPDSRDVPALGAVIGSFAGLGEGIRRGGVHPKLVTLFGRGNDATDPRDHIYAMAGLVKLAQASHREQTRNPPPPAYAESIETVMVDWAKWMIGGMDNYMLLSSVEDHSHRRLRSLPSWVPDLSVSMVPNTFRYLDQHRQWRPSGDVATVQLLPVPYSTHVVTRAAVFDTVTAVAEPFGVMQDTHDYTSILQLPTSHRHDPDPYEDTAYTIIARTMTAGNTRDYDAETLRTVLQTWITAKTARAASVGNNVPDPTTRQQVEWFDATSDQIRRGRRLFLTQRGYIGIAAQSTETGDGVWILPGAATPFLFRRHDAESHKLVGEAYVHGIMEGEFVERDNAQWQDLRIS